MARALFRVYVIFLGMILPIAVLFLLGKRRQIDFVWYVLTLLMAHGNNSVNCVVYALIVLGSFPRWLRKTAGIIQITTDMFRSRKVRTFDGRQELAVGGLPLAAPVRTRVF